MASRFKIFKNIRKGIEGAILSGGAAGAALEIVQRSNTVEVDDIEQAVSVLVAAAVGFAFKSIRNWLKNRGR